MTVAQLRAALKSYKDTDEVRIIVPSSQYRDAGFVSTLMVDICFVSDWDLANDTCGGPQITPAYTEKMEKLRLKGIWK